MKYTIVLVIGGSVLTDRNNNKPNLKVNNILTVASEIKKALAKKDFNLVIVHGGGAFYHPIAKKFKVNVASSESQDLKYKGKQKLTTSLNKLNSKCVDLLAKNGLNVINFEATPAIVDKGKIVKMSLPTIKKFLERGFIPVLQGYIAYDISYGMFTLSSDHLGPYIAKELKADLLIGSTSVNGVFDRDPLDPKAKVLRRITPKNFRHALKGIAAPKYADVTGGMRRKLTEYVNTAKYGITSRIINPAKPNVLSETILGEEHGTLISKSKSEIKGIIFDMDGVIVDSEETQFDAYRRLFSNYDIRITKKSTEWVGQRAFDILSELMQKHQLINDINGMVAQREEIYLDLIRKGINPMPDAANTIKKLSKKHSLALASSSKSKNVEFVLKSLRLRKYFNHIISGDDVKNGKPNPEIFLLALKKLKLKPGECVIVEDSIAGAKAALRAGIQCIAIPNKYENRDGFPKSTIFVDSLKDIQATIDFI